ncbi:MAG: hypothetical protein E7A38_01385 [Leclercia adecarboxylata]|nr:hypothetical protein [Leclercia adecarboxylata]
MQYHDHVNLGAEGLRIVYAAPQLPQPAQDYFSSLVSSARVRADKAMRKFPQPNYVLNKVAEESGEVIKAVIHYTEGREEWANVEGEIVDNLAMLIRLVTEGDQVIGFTPPESCHTAMLQGKRRDLSYPVDPQVAAYEKIMQQAAIDGYVVVPVEPTAEMISSGIAAHYERSQIQINDRPAPGPMECAYMAMVAAAPQQKVKK